MEESRFVVPTYYGRQNELLEKPMHARVDFSDPFVRVLVREADGIRIVLGSHDYDDQDAPDVQIERRPNGWAIFLHPEGGSDPSGYIYFLDDGRSYLIPESGRCSTPAIEVRDELNEIVELDCLREL